MDQVYQFAPLNMSWCVNCHRNNDYIQPHRVEWSEKTRTMKGSQPPTLVERFMAETKVLAHPEIQNADLSCSTCHY
jgi:hypothetical protein